MCTKINGFYLVGLHNIHFQLNEPFPKLDNNVPKRTCALKNLSDVSGFKLFSIELNSY